MKEQLLQGIADYYKEQRRDLYRRVYKKLRHREDTEEVVSAALETMLVQVAKGRLTDVKDIPRYFTTVLNSRTIDLKRRMSTKGVYDDGLESGLIHKQQYDAPLNPEELLEKEQEGRMLIEIIDLEPNKIKRKILTKNLLHGIMVSSLVEELGLSKQYIHKVIRDFKRRY